MEKKSYGKLWHTVVPSLKAKHLPEYIIRDGKGGGRGEKKKSLDIILPFIFFRSSGCSSSSVYGLV